MKTETEVPLPSNLTSSFPTPALVASRFSISPVLLFPETKGDIVDKVYRNRIRGRLCNMLLGGAVEDEVTHVESFRKGAVLYHGDFIRLVLGILA